MQIVQIENQIDELKKSAFPEDQLNRKYLAENLAKVIINTPNAKVYSINAPWGHGKTWFIQYLTAVMGNDALCISYNAWESDYYNNPLIPVCYEITEMLHLTNEESIIKECNELKSIAEKLSFSPFFGLNLGFFSLGINCSIDSDEKIDIFKNYKDLKNEIIKFKKTLENINRATNKKIIIFVDELDRCKPDYAIKTLEIIKHFFDIEGIKFVLAVDKEQILDSIKCLYGTEKEKDGFLRKFIDIEYCLPEPSRHQYSQFLLEKNRVTETLQNFATQGKCPTLNKNHHSDGDIDYSLDNKRSFCTGNLLRYFDELGKHFNLSLRDLDRIVLNFSIIIGTFNPSKDILIPQLLLFLIIMKFKNNDDYKKIIGKEKNFSREFDYNGLPNEYKHWINALSGINTLAQAKPFENTDSIYNLINDNIPILCQYLPKNKLKYYLTYADKIEFAENFNPDLT